MILLVYFIREYYNGIFNQKFKMNITVGIPAYNEEKNIASIIIKLNSNVIKTIINENNNNKIINRIIICLWF